MEPALDQMSVCEDDQSIVFRIEGKGTMKQAPALRERAELALADGIGKLHVDLRHCSYMDSTFLGTLLLLMRAIGRMEGGEFALVSPSPQCRQLMQKMQLDKVYRILDLEELPTYLWTELPTEAADSERFERVVAEAHQELADTPGETGKMFSGLAQRLMDEWKAKRARGQGKEPQAG